jgi:uncharacterized protein (UPF0147 family)
VTYMNKTKKEEKKILRKKTNQENLAAAIGILKKIEANYFFNINRKKMIHELDVLLNLEDQKFPLPVRAATAISIIDSMSQEGRLPTHIRTMLWQIVANLEGIRD